MSGGDGAGTGGEDGAGCGGAGFGIGVGVGNGAVGGWVAQAESSITPNRLARNNDRGEDALGQQIIMGKVWMQG